jgi:hypothetical protein
MCLQKSGRGIFSADVASEMVDAGYPRISCCTFIMMKKLGKTFEGRQKTDELPS